MSSVKNSLGNLGTKLFLYPINFIISIIIARYLGVEDRGVYSYILVLLSFLIPILSFGFGAGVMYYISSKKFEVKDVFVSINFVAFFIGVFSASLVFVLWNFGFLGESAKTFSLNNILLLCGSIILNAIYFFNTRLLLGNSNFKLLNLIDIFQSLLNPAFILLFVYFFSLRIQGVFISLFIANLVLSLILVLYIIRKMKVVFLWNKYVVVSAFSYGFKGWFGDMAIKANVRLDQIILGAKISPYSLGLYSIAVLLSELIWIIPDAIGSVLFNRITKIENEKNRVNLTTRISRLLLSSSIFISIGLFLFSKYIIIPFGYGIQYISSINILLLLIPGSIAMICTKVATKLLSGSAMILRSSQIQIISSTVGITLYFGLIPAFGSYGAAIGSSLAYLTGAVYSLYLLKKHFSITLNEFLILRMDDIYWMKDKFLKLR